MCVCVRAQNFVFSEIRMGDAESRGPGFETPSVLVSSPVLGIRLPLPLSSPEDGRHQSWVTLGVDIIFMGREIFVSRVPRERHCGVSDSYQVATQG